MKFRIEIGNIGVTNEYTNKFTKEGASNIPEVYAYNTDGNGGYDKTSKYTLAFYDVNTDKEEVIIKYVGDRPFLEEVDVDDFRYLLELGYRIIQHALTVGIDLT